MLMLHAFFRRQQEEGKPREAQDDLDETALGGIPSLDFRPVLDLFAPTGNKFQMSPCRECGGTLEVGCGVNTEELSEGACRPPTFYCNTWGLQRSCWLFHLHAKELRRCIRCATSSKYSGRRFVPPPRPQIVHYDEKEIVKLRGQLSVLREELVESGKALGYSQAVAETYRQKAETSSAEFSELNNMLLRVRKPTRT